MECCGGRAILPCTDSLCLCLVKVEGNSLFRKSSTLVHIEYFLFQSADNLLQHIEIAG
jgi:hypothetical protein